LIDACISALHIHGPSRTTVEKVVALADLSPGIVRFYFDSKDAMLVASLAYLAAEFEERVMVPVAQLKDSPVAALERLVELYFDPDIASPRKVSVWYSFWGEASSRQEYYDICGRKDEDFAALVRDLVARVIALTGEAHLDTDGIALGLMGVLEVLWQGIAFQSEADIDRAAARAQSMAFLRSVFPREFGAPHAANPATDPGARAGAGAGVDADAGARAGAGAAVGADAGLSATADGALTAPLRRDASSPPRHLPASAYSDAILLTVERERLFRPAWQVIGHEAELPSPGDFLTGDLGGERALVVRDEKGGLRAFRNACRRRPHALVSARTGHFSGAIPCAPHGLEWSFDGTLLDGGTEGDLTALEIKLKSGLILVRGPGAAREGGPAFEGWEELAGLTQTGVQEFEVAADWKVLVEQWLEGSPIRGRFLAPNQLIEVWLAHGSSGLAHGSSGLAHGSSGLGGHGSSGPAGGTVLRVWPTAPGRSRLQRLDFGARQGGAVARDNKRGASAAKAGGLPRSDRGGGANLLLDKWIAQQIELAESTQTGLATAGDAIAENGPVSAALAEFRGSIAVLLPHLGTSSQAG
jgi:TetR/AcrR family transcriptional regulator, transcriptional repressor of bet genes